VIEVFLSEELTQQERHFHGAVTGATLLQTVSLSPATA
jgi:hypothetical protein